MSQRRNIALIIHKLTSGGAQKMLANLSIYLQDYYSIHVIVFDGSTKTYEVAGELHDLSLPPANNKVGQVLTFFKRVKRVKQLKEDMKIDCSISFLDGPNLVNYLSKHNEKTVLSIRSYLSLTPMKWYRRIYTRYISNHSDYTVAISKMVEKDLISNFKVDAKKLGTIYNACNTDLIRKLSKEREYTINRKESDFYFVTVGRLTEAKGHWHLIRAFRKLVDEYKDVRLIIVGKGELEKKTKDLVSNLELEDNVIFTGFQNNPHSIVEQCDVFVFSSIFEGFGNVIVDALALSKPIIATDCFTGPRDILAPDTNLSYQTNVIEKAEYGILVPVGGREHFNSEDKLSTDETLLFEAMKMMYLDKELRIHYEKKGMERAEKFSVDSSKSNWIQLIERICDEHDKR